MAEGSNPVQAIVGVVVTVLVVWYFFGGGLNNKVAKDAEEQYEIAIRSGSAIDKCVHAGIVAAAYLQAKDEKSYVHWKATESTMCSIAGLPR